MLDSDSDGLVAMSEYRLYCLNDAGKFSKAHDIQAPTDEQAIKEARALKLPIVCELWEQGRMVAKLDAHREPLI